MSPKKAAAKVAAKDHFAELSDYVSRESFDALTDRARELLRDEMHSYVELGLIIWRAKEKDLHAVQSFETWVLVVLKITMRKATELRSLAEAIVAAQLGEADLQGITASSALVLRPVLAEGKTYAKDLPRLLEIARKVSVRDLAEQVKVVIKREEKPAKAADLDRTLKALRNSIRDYLKRTDSMKWKRLAAAKMMISCLESALNGISITCTFTDIKSGEVLEVETPQEVEQPTKAKAARKRRVSRPLEERAKYLEEHSNQLYEDAKSLTDGPPSAPRKDLAA